MRLSALRIEQCSQTIKPALHQYKAHRIDLGASSLPTRTADEIKTLGEYAATGPETLFSPDESSEIAVVFGAKILGLARTSSDKIPLAEKQTKYDKP